MSRQNSHNRQTSEGLNQLDSVFEHRIRLGACVLLSNVDAFSFARLKELLEATDGNLGAHLRKLEESGYLKVSKEFQKRKPVSWYSLTGKGRKALASHLTAMELLIKGTKLG